MAIKWITSKQPVIFNSRHQRYRRPAVVELKIDSLCGSHENGLTYETVCLAMSPQIERISTTCTNHKSE